LTADLVNIEELIEKPHPQRRAVQSGGRRPLCPHPGRLRTDPRTTARCGGEIQLTDGIAALLASEQVLAYRYHGKRYDCGSKLGLMQASVVLGEATLSSAASFPPGLRTGKSRAGNRRINWPPRPERQIRRQTRQALGRLPAGRHRQFVSSGSTTAAGCRSSSGETPPRRRLATSAGLKQASLLPLCRLCTENSGDHAPPASTGTIGHAIPDPLVRRSRACRQRHPVL
jgi:hypothetical protein